MSEVNHEEELQHEEEGGLVKFDEAGVVKKGCNVQLAEYIKKVNAFPMLSEAEERALLTQFFNERNAEAGHKILNSHLRLVVKIAFQHQRYHAQLFDLIAEGNLGLMRALKSFSPEKNVRFSTYAMLWIKAQMKEFLLRADSIVKIGTTASRKRVIAGLSRVKKYLGVIDARTYEANLPKIAQMLNVKEAELREVNAAMLNTLPNSLNAKLGEDEGGEVADLTAGNIMNGEEFVMERDSTAVLKRKLQNAFAGLSEREVMVVKYRILKDKKHTLAELSKRLGVSAERIRQIEELALKKLRSILKSDDEILKYVK